MEGQNYCPHTHLWIFYCSMLAYVLNQRHFIQSYGNMLATQDNMPANHGNMQGIHRNVQPIHGNVQPIHANLQAIHGHMQAIHAYNDWHMHLFDRMVSTTQHWLTNSTFVFWACWMINTQRRKLTSTLNKFSDCVEFWTCEDHIFFSKIRWYINSPRIICIYIFPF